MTSNDKIGIIDKVERQEWVGRRDKADRIDPLRRKRRQSRHHRGGYAPLGSDEPDTNTTSGHAFVPGEKRRGGDEQIVREPP